MSASLLYSTPEGALYGCFPTTPETGLEQGLRPVRQEDVLIDNPPGFFSVSSFSEEETNRADIIFIREILLLMW